LSVRSRDLRRRRVFGISVRMLISLRSAQRRKREWHHARVSPVDTGFTARLIDLSSVFKVPPPHYEFALSPALTRPALDFYRTFIKVCDLRAKR
jgi:hypothetical protein